MPMKLPLTHWGDSHILVGAAEDKRSITVKLVIDRGSEAVNQDETRAQK